MKKMNDEIVRVRMPADMKKNLERIANSRGLSMSGLIRMTLADIVIERERK